MFCGDCSTNTGQNRTQLNSRLQHRDVNDEEWRKRLCFVPTGLHSSYGAHAGQMDPELRAPLSPDCHMTPVFDERSFHSPVYHSPAHEAQGTLYRSNTGTAAHQVTKQLFFNSFLWIAIILRSWFHFEILISFLCFPALFLSPQAWGPSLEPQATVALSHTKEAATEWLTQGCMWSPTGSLENLFSPTVTLLWWTESPLVPRPLRAFTRTLGTDT